MKKLFIVVAVAAGGALIWRKRRELEGRRREWAESTDRVE